MSTFHQKLVLAAIKGVSFIPGDGLVIPFFPVPRLVRQTADMGTNPQIYQGFVFEDHNPTEPIEP